MLVLVTPGNPRGVNDQNAAAFLGHLFLCILDSESLRDGRGRRRWMSMLSLDLQL